MQSTGGQPPSAPEPVAVPIPTVPACRDEAGGWRDAPTTDDFYRLLADNTRDVVLVYCPDLTIQWVSPSVREVLGVDPNTLIGTSDRLVDQRDLGATEEALRAAIADHHDHVRGRVRIPHTDGRLLWFDASATFVWDDAGGLQHAIASLRDVTAEVEVNRKLAASERRFRTAMADSAIGMALVAPGGAFLEVNNALCEFFGYDAPTLLTKTWQELTHPYDLKNDLSALQRLIAGNADRYRLTKRYLTAEGDVVVGDLSVSAIREEDGTLSYLVSQIVDVTEQTRIQLELAQSEEHFRLIADNASDVVVRASNEGVIQWVSKSVTAARGWEPDELVGRQFADLVHPDDAPTVELVQRGVRSGEQAKFEVRVRSTAGDFRWFSITVSPIRSANGVMLGRVSSWRDVDSEVAARELATARVAEFKLLAEHASDMVVRIGSDDRIEWVSPSASSTLGWWPDDMEGRPAADFLDPTDLDRYGTLVAGLQPGQPERASGRVRCADGNYRWFASIATRIVDSRGHDVGRIVGMRDIDADVQSVEALTTSEAGLRAAMESAPAGMAMVDLERQFVQVNDALMRLFGRDREWLLSHTIADLLPPDEDAADLNVRGRILAGDIPSHVQERQILLADGSTMWVLHSVGLLRDETGTPQAFFSQFVDIDQAMQARSDLEFQATHDPLTRLPNRRALQARMEDLLVRPLDDTQTGVLFFDLDELKRVNDEYGHLIGDTLLVTIGQRVADLLREEDLVARLGGDEFVCLLPSMRDEDDLLAVAEKVHRAIAEPVTIRHAHLIVTVSVGAALARPGDRAEDVVARADQALYEAKRAGGDRVHVFHGEPRGPSPGL